jgi:ABC-type antimicrobial peptide transport system permease subunit
VKQTSLESDRVDAVYVPSHQWHWADRVRWIVVRADGDPLALAPAVRRAVWSVDGDQPIVRTQTLRSLVARSEAQRRFVQIVLLAFALSALALAGIGLFGVLSSTVSERLREIGVRSALGATRESLVTLVMGQGLLLTATGVGIGLAAAALASKALAALLFGVSRLDPATYLAVVGLLTLVAVVACWIPARRASRVDPLTTLRAD